MDCKQGDENVARNRHNVVNRRIVRRLFISQTLSYKTTFGCHTFFHTQCCCRRRWIVEVKG